MRRWNRLAWLGWGLCLLLAGCRQPAQPAVSAPAVREEQKAPQPAGSAEEQPVLPVDPAARGRVRIPYSESGSTARYITSADQVPDNQELAKYDEAYFEAHALVVVMDSTNSGSIQPVIDAIRPTGQGYSVVLSRTSPEPGQAVTGDMASWLLWAEVDTGLEGDWRVENPASPGAALER